MLRRYPVSTCARLCFFRPNASEWCFVYISPSFLFCSAPVQCPHLPHGAPALTSVHISAGGFNMRGSHVVFPSGFYAEAGGSLRAGSRQTADIKRLVFFVFFFFRTELPSYTTDTIPSKKLFNLREMPAAFACRHLFNGCLLRSQSAGVYFFHGRATSVSSLSCAASARGFSEVLQAVRQCV